MVRHEVHKGYTEECVLVVESITRMPKDYELFKWQYKESRLYLQAALDHLFPSVTQNGTWVKLLNYF